jgi:hypothetical protein
MRICYYSAWKKPCFPHKTRIANIGDPIQSVAAENILGSIGILSSDIAPINRYEVNNYDGEPVIFILNGYEEEETTYYGIRNFPPSDKICPVYISFSLGRELRDDELANMKRFEPVGCRDEYTKVYLQSKGINAYLSGCLTLTLPKRSAETAAKANKVFIADLPEKYLPLIPPELTEDAEFVTHNYRVDGKEIEGVSFSDSQAKAFHEAAKALLRRYRNEAKLVITTRLHAAAPCLAMGIPVVLLGEYYDSRYEFIDKLIPLNRFGEMDKVNWNPEPIDIEPLKHCMQAVLKDMIQQGSSDKTAELESFLMFDAPRSQPQYQSKAQAVLKRENLPLSGFKYAIIGWDRFTLQVINSVKRIYPNSELTAIFDRGLKFPHEGVEIRDPSEMSKLPEDVIVIVAADNKEKSLTRNGYTANCKNRVIVINGYL